ncbi:hypothetical protein F53441_5600 [Fusarium austroafricanum]|uniref:Uncharacterized protein n=1 Tax=Fusarium austroafricanum TaxID=2364996 RepID=A0A8H4KHR2_9HYPO|nr:hypothetical protein F53441_5600 [Fusarium austroafricanum]
MSEQNEKKDEPSHNTNPRPAPAPAPAPTPAPAPPTNGENTSSKGHFSQILEPSDKNIGFRMLLLGSEDGLHEELQRWAKQVNFRFEDMIPTPEMPGVFRLPRPLLPESAIKLFKCFYDGKRDNIFQWAKGKGLLLDKLTKHGPQIILLRRSEISVARNEISFSIVVPNPYKAQTAATQTGRVAVSITSSISSNIPAHSRRDLEVGDVIVLEELERLLVSGGDETVGEVRELFLVSTVHVANFVGQGKGGWNETINMEEDSQPIA